MAYLNSVFDPFSDLSFGLVCYLIFCFCHLAVAVAVFALALFSQPQDSFSHLPCQDCYLTTTRIFLLLLQADHFVPMHLPDYIEIEGLLIQTDFQWLLYNHRLCIVLRLSTLSS